MEVRFNTFPFSWWWDNFPFQFLIISLYREGIARVTNYPWSRAELATREWPRYAIIRIWIRCIIDIDCTIIIGEFRATPGVISYSRDSLVTRKIIKNWMENYFHGYIQWECIESKLHQYRSIHYKVMRRNIDICTVNRDKKFRLNLVIWGKFY